MAEELKRCPFCGGLAQLRDGGGMYVACIGGACVVGPRHRHDGSPEQLAIARTEAVAAWNRRVPVLPPAAPSEAEERLQQACEFAAGAIEDAIYLDDGLDGGDGEAVLATMRDLGASIPQRPRRLWDETLALLAEARGISRAEAMGLVADRALATDARPLSARPECVEAAIDEAIKAHWPQEIGSRERVRWVIERALRAAERESGGENG